MWLEELCQEEACRCGDKDQQRVSKVTGGCTVDGGLVRELDSRGESGGVGGIDIRGDVGRGLDGVIAGDIDRANEGVEVACCNVVGIVPIDHASSPLNGTRRGSLDASGPDTIAGIRMLVRSETRDAEGGFT